MSFSLSNADLYCLCGLVLLIYGANLLHPSLPPIFIGAGLVYYGFRKRSEESPPT